MRIDNYTLAEQIKLAEQTDNQVALALASNLIAANEGPDANNVKIKEYAESLLAEKLDLFAQSWMKEFSPGGYEYECYDECYASAVSDQCRYYTDTLERHINEIITIEEGPYFERVAVPQVTAESYNTWLSLTEKEMEELAYNASFDIYNTFKTDTVYAMSSSRPYFYCAMFGENETDLNDLDFIQDIPHDENGELLIDLSELSTDLYIDGTTGYLNMTDQGIGYKISLEWLEEELTRIREEREIID